MRCAGRKRPWAVRRVGRQVALQMRSMRAETNRKLCGPQSAKGRNSCWEDHHQNVVGDLQLLLWILVFGCSVKSSPRTRSRIPVGRVSSSLGPISNGKNSWLRSLSADCRRVICSLAGAAQRHVWSCETTEPIPSTKKSPMRC